MTLRKSCGVRQPARKSAPEANQRKARAASTRRFTAIQGFPRPCRRSLRRQEDAARFGGPAQAKEQRGRALEPLYQRPAICLGFATDADMAAFPGSGRRAVSRRPTARHMKASVSGQGRAAGPALPISWTCGAMWTASVIPPKSEIVRQKVAAESADFAAQRRAGAAGRRWLASTRRSPVRNADWRDRR